MRWGQAGIRVSQRQVRGWGLSAGAGDGLAQEMRSEGHFGEEKGQGRGGEQARKANQARAYLPRGASLVPFSREQS